MHWSTFMGHFVSPGVFWVTKGVFQGSLLGRFSRVLWVRDSAGTSPGSPRDSAGTSPGSPRGILPGYSAGTGSPRDSAGTSPGGPGSPRGIFPRDLAGTSPGSPGIQQSLLGLGHRALVSTATVGVLK